MKEKKQKYGAKKFERKWAIRKINRKKTKTNGQIKRDKLDDRRKYTGKNGKLDGKQRKNKKNLYSFSRCTTEILDKHTSRKSIT